MNKKEKLSYKLAETINNKLMENDLKNYLNLIKSESIKIDLNKEMRFNFEYILYDIYDNKKVIDEFLFDLFDNNIKNTYKLLDINQSKDKEFLIIKAKTHVLNRLIKEISDTNNSDYNKILNILSTYNLKLPDYLKSDSKETVISNLQNMILNNALFDNYISNKDLEDSKIIKEYNTIYKNIYNIDLNKTINEIGSYLNNFYKKLTSIIKEYNELNNYIKYLDKNIGNLYRKYIRKNAEEVDLILSLAEITKIIEKHNFQLPSFVSKIDILTDAKNCSSFEIKGPFELRLDNISPKTGNTLEYKFIPNRNNIISIINKELVLDETNKEKITCKLKVDIEPSTYINLLCGLNNDNLEIKSGFSNQGVQCTTTSQINLYDKISGNVIRYMPSTAIFFDELSSPDRLKNLKNSSYEIYLSN